MQPQLYLTKADFNGSRNHRGSRNDRHMCTVDHYQFEEEVRPGQYARFTGFCTCGNSVDGYAVTDGFDDETGNLEWAEPDFKSFDIEEFEDRLNESLDEIAARIAAETDLRSMKEEHELRRMGVTY